MSNKIIKKYRKLYEACKKYPPIILSNKIGEKPKFYKESKGYERKSR